MRHINALLSSCFCLMTLACNVSAQSTASIPDKVRADILKRHPKAIDLAATPEIHFQHRLLEVSFKEEGGEETFLELFREDGHLFTNEVPMTGLGAAPSIVKEELDKAFPGFVLNKSELTVNPNGIGEEYEVFLKASGANWKVFINDKGVIQAKERY